MRREQDGAIITQFDYPTCETLGLLKMDFLGLRNLTVIDDASPTSRPTAASTVVIEDLTFDDPADLRAAGTRRHPGRLPARRRADALAAARDAARTASRTSRLSSRSTGPGRWRPTRTSTTPTARTAASRSSPIHPELAEPLAEILDETYGLVVYQEQVRRSRARSPATRWARPTCFAGPWARRRRPSWTPSCRDVHRRDARQRGFSSRRDQGALEHAAALLRLRLQQVPHARATGWSRTGPPT